MKQNMDSLTLSKDACYVLPHRSHHYLKIWTFQHFCNCPTSEYIHTNFSRVYDSKMDTYCRYISPIRVYIVEKHSRGCMEIQLVFWNICRVLNYGECILWRTHVFGRTFWVFSAFGGGPLWQVIVARIPEILLFIRWEVFALSCSPSWSDDDDNSVRKTTADSHGNMKPACC